MAQRVRFTRDFDFWPSATVVIAHKAGEEKRLPQAQVEAALTAGAAEIVDGSGGEDQRAERPAAKAGVPA